MSPPLRLDHLVIVVDDRSRAAADRVWAEGGLGRTLDASIYERRVMSDGSAGEQLAHCEWCGAEYAEPGEAVLPERRAPSRIPARRPEPPPALGAEPPTHCEWCGAEYPVPGAEDA